MTLLAEAPLIDKRYARLVLNNDALDESYDELLDILIGAYSAAVTDYCERMFAPLDDTTIMLNALGPTLDLRPYEIRSADTITSTTSDGTELDSALWRLAPDSLSRWGTYLWMNAPAWTPYPYGVRVEIHGDWGMAETPANVKLAVAACVDNYFLNVGGHGSRSLGALSFTEETKSEEGLEICSAARKLLRPFVRY